MKTLVYILILASLLVSTGCSESAVPEDTVLNIAIRTRGPHAAAFYEHIDKYIQLKETHPALAFVELKKAVLIQYEGHPKSEEYLILLFNLDTAGRATLPQTLAGNELVLEMIVDQGFPNEVIQLQRKSVERDAQRIKALKTEGKDPDEQYFRFIFILTE